MSAPVRLSVEAGIARLILDRPAEGNTMNPAMARALRDAVASLGARSDVRVVVLTSSGSTFSFGGDVRWMARQGDDVSSALAGLADDLHAAIEGLGWLAAPVVAGVRGMAAGGGLSLLCASDVVLAGPAARFTLAYTGIGLSPDLGATWFLPRLIGLRRATELALTNRVVEADEAARIGLVTRVVDDARLDDELEALVASLAAGPTIAYGAVKRLLKRSATATLREQLDREAVNVARTGATRDGREGVDAFLAKRAPRFTGGLSPESGST